MLKQSTKQALMSNWGDKANAMDCYAEVKFIDPLGGWDCYLLAMNPINENDLQCIVVDRGDVELCEMQLSSLLLAYNREGEYFVLDPEYRRVKASELYKRLTRGK